MVTQVAEPKRARALVLRNREDFQRLSRNGKRWSSRCFFMQAQEQQENHPHFRFGLTASRKTGNAVVRNRARRRLREIVQTWHAGADRAQISAWDLVLIAKPCAATAEFDLLCQDFIKGLRALGITS